MAKKHGASKQHSNKTLTMIGILIFIIGISYFLWVFFFSGLLGTSKDYVVPDLAGYSIAEAQAKYKDFNIVQGETVSSDTYDKGLIVSQDPPKDQKVSKNTTITVDISSGPETIEVPNLVNKEYNTAKRQLDALNLTSDVEYTSSQTVTEGYVISTTPSVGTPLSPGGTVHLVVSTGPENVDVVVPTLVGLSEEDARSTIKDLGFKVGTVKHVPSNQLAGTVVYQSVPPASEVPEGTTIYLQVSSGPSTVSAAPSESAPTASPSVTASSDPTKTPTKSKKVTVKLPSGEGMVQVRMLYNGEQVYEQTVNRSLGTIYPTINGSGSGTLNIYFDGTLSNSASISFD